MSRTKGALGVKTKLANDEVDPNDLYPPQIHNPKQPWTEAEAVEEMEFLIRYLCCKDPKMLFPSHCLAFRGYRDKSLYNKLAKQFPEKCHGLYEFAMQIAHDKIATGALNKTFDSRFAVYASPNMSNWRQQQQIDVATNVSIHTKDYKGVQPLINERMERKKKGQ